MHDICTYHIVVKGEVDEMTLNVSSPVRVRVTEMNVAATYLTIHADQSGLIGLLRHLHQQGFVLLLVSRGPQNVFEEKQNEVSNSI